RVPPPPGASGTVAARPQCAVHLRPQVRGPLPPPPDGGRDDPGEVGGGQPVLISIVHGRSPTSLKCFLLPPRNAPGLAGDTGASFSGNASLALMPFWRATNGHAKATSRWPRPPISCRPPPGLSPRGSPWRCGRARLTAESVSCAG